MRSKASPSQAGLHKQIIKESIKDQSGLMDYSYVTNLSRLPAKKIIKNPKPPVNRYPSVASNISQARIESTGKKGNFTSAHSRISSLQLKTKYQPQNDYKTI